MYTVLCVFRCTSVWRSEDSLEWFSLSIAHFFSRQGLILVWKYPCRPRWPESLRDPLVPVSPMPILQTCATIPGVFYTGSGCQIQVFVVSQTSALLREPSPQLLYFYFGGRVLLRGLNWPWTCLVAQEYLDLASPASASRVAGVIGLHHQACLKHKSSDVNIAICHLK